MGECDAEMTMQKRTCIDDDDDDDKYTLQGFSRQYIYCIDFLSHDFPANSVFDINLIFDPMMMFMIP